MATAHEIYDSTVRKLPPSERLRLATLILQELSESASLAFDACEPWTQEDEQDVTRFALAHAAVAYPEEEELA